MRHTRSQRALRAGAMLLALAGVPVPAARADYTVTVQPGDVRTARFDGWGCSLAWWAHQFGDGANADALADLCFTPNTVSWQGESLPGLNLNIVRYNAGACSWNEVAGRKMIVGKIIQPLCTVRYVRCVVPERTRRHCRAKQC